MKKIDMIQTMINEGYINVEHYSNTTRLTR